ncbi:MAG: TIGR02206 family membrane protein [Phycisphaerae bacterium]|nr:TIGR02206 family membrane protein [Phycisphaerae bacterium]MCZ2401146.1 TIGR02206 family membrane protein [Phycisphaerae bacterium]
MLASETLVLFGPDHVAALVATALVTAGLCLWLRRVPAAAAARSRLIACAGLAIVLLTAAVTGHVYQVLHGSWTIAKSLPLHLCNLATLVAAAALLLVAAAPRQALRSFDDDRASARRPSITQVMYELTYYWGIGGTTQAMLTPEIDEPFPTTPYLVFFVTHGGIIAAAFMMTVGLRMRPRPDSAPRVWMITVVVAFLVLCFNTVTGTNYMYLAGPPERASLYDYLGPWPLSLLSLAVVATTVFALCYLPFWLKDRARRDVGDPRVENAG